MSQATPVPVPDANPGAPAVPVDPNANPAAAPAVQSAPLNVDTPKAPVVPDPDESVVVQYNPTGDVGLDLALTFIGGLGMGPERPDVQAAQKGDFAPLEATLKGLGDKAKGYAPYLQAAKESYQRSTDTKKAKADKAEKLVHDAVGGVEQWNAIHAWVVAEADAEQKEAINAAFQAGGFAAEAMARQLKGLYDQSGQSNAKPKSPVKPGASAAGPADSGHITRAEYKDEIRKLEAKFGNRLTETEEYSRLAARRLAALNAQQ